MTEPQEPHSGAAQHPAPEELSEFAFSPEAAPAGLQAHVRVCPSCAAQTAELRTVLASLAALPEPAVPESVGIRLDAALARAWQEADEQQSAAAGAETGSRTTAVRRSQSRWRRFALPLGALCLVAVAALGVGRLLTSDRSAASGASSGADGPASDDAALTAWVHSVLPGTAGGSTATRPAIVPQIGHGTTNHTFAGPMCPSAPVHAGYTELTSSQREFDGRAATLVVYQNAQEPASRLLLAVVYAGSCPAPSSVVLDQALVSR